MDSENREMIGFLFDTLNTEFKFAEVVPGTNFCDLPIHKNDIKSLAISIETKFKKDFGANFKFIKEDGIWDFWINGPKTEKQQVSIFLTGCFFLVSQIKKREEIKIVGTRSGKGKFGSNYWKEYTNWYKIKKVKNELPDPNSVTTGFSFNRIKEQLEFKVLDDGYWNEINSSDFSEEQLFAYYLATNSSEKIVPYIIARGEHITPELIKVKHQSHSHTDLSESIETLLMPSLLLHGTLIKILGEIGQGKTTFLLHLGYRLRNKFHVLYFKLNHAIDQIFHKLPDFDDQRPVLLLIDDARNHKEKLEEYAEALKLKYPHKKYVLAIAERIDRYKTNEFLEEKFNNVYKIEYRLNSNDFGKFFDKFWDFLQRSEGKQWRMMATAAKANYKMRFCNNNLTLTEKIEDLYSSLGINNHLNKRRPEWEDWDANIDQRFIPIGNLYTIVSLFYKFGIPVPLGYFDLASQDLIIDALLRDRLTSSIILDDENNLKLVHESKANKFLSEENNQRKASNYFHHFLENISTKQSAKLFRNIYTHPEFRKNPFLTKHINKERCIAIFRGYLPKAKDDDEKGKTIIFLCRAILKDEAIKIDNKPVQEVIQILDRHIKSHKKNLQTRAMLSSLQIELKNFRRAYQVLNQILQIDQNNIEAIINLVTIYSKVKSKKEKIWYLLERLQKLPDFKSQTLIPVLRRSFAPELLVCTVTLLEYYVSNNDDPEGGYLLDKAYRKISSLNLSNQKEILWKVRASQVLLGRHRLMGAKKSDGLKIKLIELCISVDELRLARKELKTIKDKSHINYKLVYSRIHRLQNNPLVAYQILLKEHQTGPVNLSVMVLLIKTCVECEKYEEAKKYILEFFEVKCFDNEVLSIYLNILSTELGKQRGTFSFIESYLLMLMSGSNANDPVLSYIYSGLCYKWAIIMLKKESVDNRISSILFAKDRVKKALQYLPTTMGYSPVKQQYQELLGEIQELLVEKIPNYF